MKKNRKANNIITSFMFGSIVSALFVVTITVLGELIAPIKNLLAEQHYHHWVGKGIWTLIFYFATTLIFYLATTKRTVTDDQTKKWTLALGHVCIFVSIALFAFFVYEYIIHH